MALGVDGPTPAKRLRRRVGDDALNDALASAVAGSDAGFGVLYRAVQPGLVRYLRTLVGQDADDIASEAWAHACRDLAVFRGDSDGFRRWITVIARNRAMDHLRARGRRPVYLTDPETLREVAGTHDTADQATAAIGTAQAVALIASLPPDQADAVLLRVLMGLDAKSAGAVLGKRAGSVRTSAYRGLKTLAAQLEAEQQ